MIREGRRPAVECIIALDLCSESYRQLELPLDVDDDGVFHNRLDCLGEHLMLSYGYAERFDVWMMKDCDGESSWMKFISLDRVYNIGIYLVSPKIVAYIDSIKHVLIQNRGKFLWFNVENKRGKIISIDGIGDFSSQAFNVRHVRLPGRDDAVESAAAEGSLKRKRNNSKER